VAPSSFVAASRSLLIVVVSGPEAKSRRVERSTYVVSPMAPLRGSGLSTDGSNERAAEQRSVIGLWITTIAAPR